MNASKPCAAILMALGVATSCQSCTSSTTRFQLVSGAGYEGVIVPARMATGHYRFPGVTSYWTPSAADVTRLEASLSKYFKQVAANPSQVSPPIRFGITHPPYELEDFRSLASRFDRLKRQYLGLAYGPRRRILVLGFPDADWSRGWRAKVVDRWILDVGCGFWYVQFDVADSRVVRFDCQGLA